MVDRLVDPMLGGVYAGRADTLSLAATMPALARTARVETTLTGAVRAAQAAAPRAPGRPVFATVEGGLSRLVAAAAEELVTPAGTGPGGRRDRYGRRGADPARRGGPRTRPYPDRLAAGDRPHP